MYLVCLKFSCIYVKSPSALQIILVEINMFMILILKFQFLLAHKKVIWTLFKPCFWCANVFAENYLNVCRRLKLILILPIHNFIGQKVKKCPGEKTREMEWINSAQFFSVWSLKFFHFYEKKKYFLRKLCKQFIWFSRVYLPELF